MHHFISHAWPEHEVGQGGECAGRSPTWPSARDDRILGAAERLFLQAGYQQVSLTHVAVAAGVPTRTLYARFRSKRALLEAVIQARSEASARALAQIAAERLPLERKLQRLAAHACEHELTPRVDLLHADLLSERDLSVRVKREWAYAGPWRELLEAALGAHIQAHAVPPMCGPDVLAGLFAALLMREHASTGPFYADENTGIEACEDLGRRVVTRFLAAATALPPNEDPQRRW